VYLLEKIEGIMLWSRDLVVVVAFFCLLHPELARKAFSKL